MNGERRARHARGRRWELVLPAAFLLSAGVLMVGAWWQVGHQRAAQIQLETRVNAEHLEARLVTWVDARGAVLDKLARDMAEPGIRDPLSMPEAEALFRREASLLVALFDGFQAINWVDADGHIRITVPAATNEGALGANLQLHPEPSVRRSFRRAMASGAFVRTGVVELLQGGRGLATYAPVSGGEAPPSGFVNGVFRLDVLIDSCFPEPQLTEAFRFSLHDEEGRLAYRSEEAQVGSLRTGDEAADWPFQATKDVRVIDRDMVLRVAPTEAHLASVKTHANDGLLAAGLMVSLLLALVLHAYLKGQRRLREREEDLRQSQKVEAIGQLAGGIAHDFNNILQVILGHAELAVESRGNSNEVEENVEAIVHAAQRASSLTQQLLDFSRRRQIHPERLDINDVVEELLGLARRTIDERVEILFHPTRELPAVTGDPRQIEQVVLNLCLNARDAMPDGGRLVVETFRTAVDRTVRASYPWVEVGPMVGLRVRDEGCGMDAATLDRAFEPFFTTKEVGQGTGLGLSSAYGIVRQHGGLIRATSAPGRGTSVEVLLPPAA